jgi:hypothetical protein
MKMRSKPTLTKTALKAKVLKEIKRYEAAAHCKVIAVSFPSKNRRVVYIDTVPMPD